MLCEVEARRRIPIDEKFVHGQDARAHRALPRRRRLHDLEKRSRVEALQMRADRRPDGDRDAAHGELAYLISTSSLSLSSNTDVQGREGPEQKRT